MDDDRLSEQLQGVCKISRQLLVRSLFLCRMGWIHIFVGLLLSTSLENRLVVSLAIFVKCEK